MADSAEAVVHRTESVEDSGTPDKESGTILIRKMELGFAGALMGRGKIYSPDEVVQILRKINAAVADGMKFEQACGEAGISETSYYRCRNKFGTLRADQAHYLIELEQENARLRRLVAELSLDKLVLKDIISGNL